MNQIARKMELAFWDRVIPLLTNSSLVRTSIQRGYAIVQQKSALIQPLIWAMMGFSGLLVGMFLGKVVAILW